MMLFDFDAPISRSNSDSVRWDAHIGSDVIPLWVADMDFRSPPCVIEALLERVQHGIFGYTHAPVDLRATICQHLEHEYRWRVDPDWIVILPSVVSGLYTAVRELTKAEDHVLIPKPVYHHLRLACSNAPRHFTEIPLVLEDDRWVMPWSLLKTFCTDHTKLALLCNPQNPGGTVYSQSELTQFAHVCEQNDMLICSDEIHAGLILNPALRHTPIASLSQSISMRTVTLMSLNKTFNFPGIGLAWAVAENPVLRQAMQTNLHQTIADPGLLAYTATLSALKNGAPWRQSLLEYLRHNRDLVIDRIKAIPQLNVSNIEATYLAWIDCSGLNHPDPYALFLAGGVALSPGAQFNASQCVRLNFATQRARLNTALDRIALAVNAMPSA